MKEQTTPSPTKIQRLEIAIAELDRHHGAGSVVRLGNDKIEKIPAISTGALTLDMAIGLGGLPEGRIAEIYGTEASGKTTLALSVVAQAQALGKTCVYVDAEQALDPLYARTLGLNMDDLYLASPDYGEQAFDIVEKVIKSGAVDVVIIDSVAALVPKAELEADMESMQMGAQARMMAKGLRKINGLLSSGESKTLVIFINQLRQKIGVMFGSLETTPGGLALKYYCSVRIDLRKIEDLKNKNTGYVEGSKIRAKIVKNKVGPPLRLAEFDIQYGKGIDTIGCVFDLAVDRGIYFKKSGTWFADGNGETYAQGREGCLIKLREDPELVKEIKELILNEGL